MHPPRPRPPRPIGFAHRGARAELRENTLAAFALALELGASGLESDAWLTADREVVLDHDGVIGPRWRRRPIATQLRLALPAHIPSLVELYQAVGSDFELSLDLKNPAALAPILAVADRAAANDRLWLCHGDRRLLAGWRTSVGAARLVESTSVRRVRDSFESWVDGSRAAGIDAVNLHRREWTGDRVTAVHAVDLSALGWDCQSPGEIARLLDYGIDGVYSDHPELVAAAMNGRP